MNSSTSVSKSSEQICQCGRSENVYLRPTHTLVKLSVASAGHGRVITPVDLSNVVALDVGYLVHRQVAGEGHL